MSRVMPIFAIRSATRRLKLKPFGCKYKLDWRLRTIGPTDIATTRLNWPWGRFMENLRSYSVYIKCVKWMAINWLHICFQAMISQFGYVHKYMDSIKDFKEKLSNPNNSISAADARLGKAVEFKVIVFVHLVGNPPCYRWNTLITTFLPWPRSEGSAMTIRPPFSFFFLSFILQNQMVTLFVVVYLR